MTTGGTLLQDKPDAALFSVQLVLPADREHLVSQNLCPPTLRNTGFVTALQRPRVTVGFLEWVLCEYGPVDLFFTYEERIFLAKR